MKKSSKPAMEPVPNRVSAAASAPPVNPLINPRNEVAAEIRIASLNIAGNVNNLGILDRMEEFHDK